MKLFRVYDKANHCWITDNVVIDRGRIAYVIRYRRIGMCQLDMLVLEPIDEALIEWNTRCYDNNNNPIYVGDIVNWNGKVTGEIRYDALQSGFYLVTEGYHKFKDKYDRVSLGFIADECTVIGNIHGLETEE